MTCEEYTHDFGTAIYAGKVCKCGQCVIIYDPSVPSGYRVEAT